MIECLQLRGLSERTWESYVQAVRQLAEHYHKSPDLITEEELRQYFLHLKNVKKYARSSLTIALCGIKLFFGHTLNKNLPALNFIRPPSEKKLPAILSVEEVHKLLGLVKVPGYRRRPSSKAASTKKLLSIRSDIPGRLIYWRPASTFVSFKSTSVTVLPRPPRQCRLPGERSG
jgi:site-specific recombinase XerD